MEVEEWRAAGAKEEQAGTKCTGTPGAAPSFASGHKEIKQVSRSLDWNGGIILT